MKDLLQSFEAIWQSMPDKLRSDWSLEARRVIKRAETKMKEPTLEKMIDHLLKHDRLTTISSFSTNADYFIMDGDGKLIARNKSLRHCVVEAMRVKNCLLPGIKL